mgnify:CR=1 FL=1
MKPHRFLIMLAFILFISVKAFAQEKEEMTKEEWQNEINILTEQKSFLNSEIEKLKTEITDLKRQREGLQSYDDCIDGIYKMLGVSKADIDNFRNRLNTLTSQINSQQGPKADRQVELDAMKKNKISALPEFFDVVHDKLQKKLDAWIEKPTEINYTVVNGDCLWNIAKKKEHYSNPFAWPIIYKANRDQIKNPDLIYPKQNFKIPNLNEDEKEKYDKIRRNYKPAPPTQSQQTTP